MPKSQPFLEGNFFFGIPSIDSIFAFYEPLSATSFFKKFFSEKVPPKLEELSRGHIKMSKGSSFEVIAYRF